MAEEVVITQDKFGRDVTIPIDENGNIILYRATDDPNRIIDSDFRPLAKDKGSVGLGQQSYFSPNPMYSHKYESSGRKNYKFVTDIKPNQILATDFPVNNYPELVKVLNIPEEYTNQTWRQLVNNNKAMIAMGYEAGGKRFFNDNIQTFKDNGIKAFGSGATGSGGQTYIEYEIIPLVKEGDTLGIKPIATLQTKEGFDAGKVAEAFIETSLDTPTNVVDSGRLVWGSEEFIDAILDDMRASAQLFEFDMEGDLGYLKRNQPEVAKQIEQGKINIANHIDFIEVTRETLDRTDLPPGLDKFSAQDEILMFVEAAQYEQRTQGTGKINGLTIPELGVTDVQAQDPEFKKIFTNQFTDTPTNVVDDFGQKGIKWAEARKALEDVNNWGEDIPILEERFIGNTNDKIILEIIPPEGNVEGLIPSEDYRLQASILRENGDIEIIKTYDNPRQFGADGKNFFNDISSLDTPTNVVDDVVVTRGLGNAEMAIPTNADGNIILYRATTDPNISIVSDFTDIGKAGQAGLGKQNYFAIDEMYAYLYSRPSINKNVYKFETNIKANQVLNLQSPTAKQLEVLSKIGINEKDLKNWYMQITGESKVNTAIQNNLDYLLDNDIKAIGNNLTGPTANVFEYEIVPIITEKTRTEIKPVSQLILDPKWEGTDRILNVENELFQSTQSTQYADKYLPTDVNNKDTKYRPVYYVDEEGIGRKNRDFQFSEQPLENNLVRDNLIEVPTDTPTNVELVKDTYVINTEKPGGSLGAAKLNDPLVFDSWVDNYGKITKGFIDDLPLEKPVKDVFLNAADSRLKKLGTQVATPGGILDTVDIWEMGVLALVAGAIAYNEIDEIPKITKNTILRTYNLSQGRPIDAPLRIIGLPVLSVSEYDIDFQYAMETLEKGEKVMPTEIAIKKVGEIAKGVGEQGLATGFGYVPTTPKNTDTMETTQKIQPGVQEEKMFEKLRPKKTKSAGGSGARIQ
jgi:hypothetical protein